MKRPKKWRAAEPFYSVDELLSYYSKRETRDNSMLWIGPADTGRPESIAWTMNRGLFTIHRLVDLRQISLAELTDEYREWLKQEGVP